NHQLNRGFDCTILSVMNPKFIDVLRFKTGDLPVGQWWLWSLSSPLINAGGLLALHGSASALR
ncbi:hypothetical protein HAX54_031993, partial [Datura stramonium]|nr:hypothetical protein [Datura stramonium]